MDLPVLLPILLSWAVRLSGYPMPEQPPVVEFKPHGFFVEEVCGGKECPAVGWYNDQGIVYIDQKYENDDSTFPSSLLVHEFTHYLQHMSGGFDSLSCEDSMNREREAYRVQNDYIVEGQGSFQMIRPGPTACNYRHTAATVVVK